MASSISEPDATLALLTQMTEIYSAPIPEDDAARLETLHRYSILDTAPEQGYDDVTSLATFICETPYSTITLVDRDRQWFKSEVGFGTRETGRSEGFCACAVLSPQTLIVQDALEDARFASNPFVLGGPKIRFYAGAPLVARNGQILGTVCVFDIRPRTLTSAQIGALETLSRQVIALFEARLRLLENDEAAKALMQTEKLAAVGKLASSMAHAINNPLEAVTNLLYLARQRIEDPTALQWLHQAEEELSRVASAANQTLQFHKQLSKPQLITCSHLISQTLDVYKAQCKNSVIRVEKRKRATAPVRCFEGDIRHLLGNLTSNAVDAMPTGGRLLVRSRDGIEWKTGRRGLTITIADTGTGMNQETKKRLFEAFYSTKGIGGSGLGLWMSADIMRRHHGTIRIRSSQREGRKGTVATIFLPAGGI